MKGVAGMLLMTCQRASEAVEKEHHKALSWVEKLQLKVHLSVCKVCNQYAIQSRLLDQMLKKNWPFREAEISKEEVDHLRFSIREKLKREE